MQNLSDFEHEVAALIIESLNLEDIDVNDIDPEAALFNDGLGLDSIDALELSMSLATNYGIKLKSDNPDNQKIFSSLRNLAAFVEANKT